MAKTKFSLTPKPTFQATVAIPVPGEGTSDVVFTFKGRTREQMRSFHDDVKELDNADLILFVASGWDLDDAFDKDSLVRLTENYLGATSAIFDTYLKELTQARLGN